MARYLWLMRHAKAAPLVPGQRDFDRPLTDRGLTQAGWIASYIAELRHETPPSWVLHSSARRTTQTAEITFPDACLIPDRGLYEADIDACVATLQEQAADHDVVALVGHNPTVHALAAWLSGDIALASAAFPPSTLCVLRTDRASWSALGAASAQRISLQTAPR